MSGNRFGDDGMSDILEGLVACPALSEFYTWGNGYNGSIGGLFKKNFFISVYSCSIVVVYHFGPYLYSMLYVIIWMMMVDLFALNLYPSIVQ